ncbi:ATP-binding protein [Mesoterricola silvestris]|uniref:histidine kinase n=1 Tax=Mesoterricola silvestris TaxID=2927979 RepID=A0AA48KAW8_9BACT|nr:ATP-binding protein [Mesoterricola silvestris]BDU71918.1 hypothetical protein METEAL_10920 [Mesoterricola silvestris]
MTKPPSPSLRTRILLLVCATLVPALLVTGLLVSWQMERHTRALLEEKAGVIAALAAQDEAVVGALAAGRPGAQACAERLRLASGVDYVVVLDLAGNRITHPNPALIGGPFKGGDDREVFRGRAYTSVAEGTLGTALRVFRPVRDPEGRQVGAVVVGVLMKGIDHHLLAVRRMVLGGLLLGLAAGVLGAFAVAWRIKRVLLGMEPGEIAAALQEQLAGVKLYADALRGQTHEFMNKLHVILGLARLGELERLTAYLADLARAADDDVGAVVRAVKDPVLAGFLLARSASAREKNLRVTLAPDSEVPAPGAPGAVHDAITILGNFLENAAEAMGAGGEIGVLLRVEEGRLEIRVEDRGPGLPPGPIFAKGFSTKGPDRGYGLHHARQRVEAAGGLLTAQDREGGGATFRAVIPFPEEVRP